MRKRQMRNRNQGSLRQLTGRLKYRCRSAAPLPPRFLGERVFRAAFSESAGAGGTYNPAPCSLRMLSVRPPLSRSEWPERNWRAALPLLLTTDRPRFVISALPIELKKTLAGGPLSGSAGHPHRRRRISRSGGESRDQTAQPSMISVSDLGLMYGALSGSSRSRCISKMLLRSRRNSVSRASGWVFLYSCANRSQASLVPRASP